MKSYPSLRYPGEEATRGLFASGEIVIQEKLDGANFRFTYDGDKKTDQLIFGSRRTFGDGLDREQFAKPIEYINDQISRDEVAIQREEIGDLVYFGEAMLPHTISYDWEATPAFLGFDIWSVEEQMFLPSDTVETLFAELDLPMVPRIDVIDAEEWEDYDFEVPESEFCEGLAEGVVFKNHTTKTYGKFVRDDFKEKNKRTFGPAKKSSLDDTERFTYDYITEARIEKAAYRLRDEGEYDAVKMEMMTDLPLEVIRDFADEEAYNVFMNERKEVDFAQFRSVVSSRCASILQRLVDKRVQENL